MMFDEDSLLVRALGWFVKPAMMGLVGWLLVWIAGAGAHGVAAYAALGATLAYARAGYGWPPNNNDWTPLAAIIWPLIAVRDIIPHLLGETEPDAVALPADVSTNVTSLDAPRPRRTA
jgi:hypothetical protein